MPTYRTSIFGPMQDVPAKKAARPLRLVSTVKNDVFLNALLEMPTTKQAHRSPLEWVGAMGFHIAIVALLVVAPLYTTAAIHLSDYHAIALLAPPPPAAPPPPPAASAVAPRITHPKAKLNYSLQKLTAPNAIPKKVASYTDDVAEPVSDLGGVAGGIPGGVVGGGVGGVIGGTGPSVPTPPPAPKPVPKIVRVGSNLKPPRQTYSVDPVYPALARETRIAGTVIVDAVIDEHGNVVEARVVNGHPLLIEAALRAVRQWKYEPTALNGQPVSVELQVQVHFNFKP
jgi:periplasmic protein TonB